MIEMFSISRILNNNASKSAISAKRQLVVEWVREKLAASVSSVFFAQALIDAMEVECTEPDCVPVETLIIIGFSETSLDGFELSQTKWAGKILKPVFDVIKGDVEELDIPFRVKDTAINHLSEQVGDLIAQLSASADLTSAMTRLQDLKKVLDEKSAEIEVALGCIAAEQARLSERNLVNSVEPKVTRVTMQSTNVSRSIEPEHLRSIDLKASKAHEVTEVTHTAELNPKDSVSASHPPKALSTVTKPGDFIVVKENAPIAVRHDKETRRRGCPCCDPDNLDHLIDKMLFMDLPPN